MFFCCFDVLPSALFALQMQIRVSEMLSEISVRHESVDVQVKHINARLNSLENQVLRLPQILSEVVKAELANHKQESISLIDEEKNQDDSIKTKEKRNSWP